MSETLSEAIGADHAAFDEYADNIRNATTDLDKIKWRNQLTWTVARHAISEELTWYPAMEKHLGMEGTKLAHEDKAGHAAVKKDLSKFQEMVPSDPDFSIMLEAVMNDLHEHIEHEKNEDMPRLEGIISREESQRLAKQFQQTKAICPTSVHPSAPEESPWQALASLMAAPIDRFRDMFKEWPDQNEVSLKA